MNARNLTPRRPAVHALAAACAMALAAAAAATSPAFAATPGVDAPPLPGPAVALAIPPIVVRTLDNGLTVIVARRTATPLVTMSVLVRAGAERDAAGHAGQANLTATLLTRGTTRAGHAIDSTGIAREAETLGGDLQAGSGFGASSVALTVTTPHAADALSLLADVVRRPTFPADEVERALAEEQDTLRLRMSSPGQVANLAARRAFWGDSPYGAGETPASLARLTREDLQRFHAEQYRPDAVAVVFAGDIDEATAMSLARRDFGDWRAPATPRAAAPIAAPATQAPVLLSIDLGGVGQSGVAVAAPYVPLGSPERYVAQVTNAVLGGGYSARLNQEVRIKRGLAYGAGSRADSQPAGGMMVARVQTNNVTAGQVVTLVRDEIARIGQVAPSAEEMAARQATLTGEFGRELDTTASFATLVGTQWVRGLPMTDLAQYVPRVMAVTGDQVRAYAAATWKPETLRIVVAGDQSKSAEGLKGTVPVAQMRAVKLVDVDFEKATLAK